MLSFHVGLAVFCLVEPESPTMWLWHTFPLPCAGIFQQTMGARNRVGTGLSYRPARLHSLADLVLGVKKENNKNPKLYFAVVLLLGLLPTPTPSRLQYNTFTKSKNSLEAKLFLSAAEFCTGLAKKFSQMLATLARYWICYTRSYRQI